MEQRKNYLLGNGESLAKNEPVARGFGAGRDPYTFSEAKTRLAPQLKETVTELYKLPDEACPKNEVVVGMTLHPKYIAKSSYPSDILDAMGLRAVGSKSVTITPQKSHLKGNPKAGVTTELFLAGTREHFRDLSTTLRLWNPTDKGADDLIKVETLHAPSVKERIKPIHSSGRELLFEVVLHAGEKRGCQYILEAFEAYLATLSIDVDLAQRIDAGDLSFVPVRAARAQIGEIAKFSFLRVAREMPRLRELWPTNGSHSKTPKCFPVKLPEGDAVDPTIRVAIFDGGHPNITTTSKWVRRLKGDGVLSSVTEYVKHGCAVTSALLFGSLDSGSPPERPYAQLDHYRVLDERTHLEPQESLYPVLKRIVSVLERQTYDFVNFSIGPSIPIDDDDVHPWTAKIDSLLASGKTLASIAVGNSGDMDAATRLNRIQPPSDCVNALSVGAADGSHSAWARASYSSVGHGRCPGVIKPDGVVFGGATGQPFWAIDAEKPTMTIPVMGTSFASPLALRTAIGVRAHLGAVITPLALKALMIHNADNNGHHSSEVGWGMLCTNVEELITCPDGTAHVLYQGELDPKKYLRAEIPMPEKPLEGLITISATICIATPTDPEHPTTYTRSGLEIFFRKDRLNIPPGKINPKSSGFFKGGLGMPEQLIREDAHQWETVRHESKQMQGKTLKQPCFDIHCNPRKGGHDNTGEKIPYAMVVTVRAPRVKDLFDRIFTRYRFQLAELKPRIELPIRLSNQ